jgi:hypothetical protein
MTISRSSGSAVPDTVGTDVGLPSYEGVLADVPGIDRIQATVDLAAVDPQDANIKILAGYFYLSQALGRLLHSDIGVPENATFLTFAAWATESLRPDIVRSVDGTVPRISPSGAGFRPARRAYRWLAGEALGSDDAVVRNIVHGEGRVYEEIATTTHHLLRHSLEAIEAFGPGPLSDDELSDTWTAFSERLTDVARTINGRRTNDDQLVRTDVYLLQRAVQPYFEVIAKGLCWPDLGEEDRRRRAQLILLANVRLLAYEQKRVQPVLERNLAYLPEAVRSWLGGELMGRNTLFDRTVRLAYKRAGTAESSVREMFQIAATRGIYSMVLGTEELRFGRDLPMPPPANPVLRARQPEQDRKRYGSGAFFPYHLENLQWRPVWAEVQRHDRSSGEGARTAVDNWLRYGERLNFLVNLFRSRQQLSTLYNAPRSAPTLPVALEPVQLLPGLRAAPSPAQQALPHFDGGNP